MRAHTHNLCKPINGWKVVGKMPLAESCLSFRFSPVKFVWLQGGCPAFCSGVFCFTFAFLDVMLQQNRSAEIYVSLLFTGTS